MGIPLQQAARIGAYLLRQHLSGRERYPLVLMLEPLFRCNLPAPAAARSTIPPRSSTSGCRTTTA